jgi:hypothetical protein
MYENPGRSDEIDLTEREDTAIFHRNPWSIAKLNALSRQQQQQQQQMNHAPAQASQMKTLTASTTLQRRHRQEQKGNHQLGSVQKVMGPETTGLVSPSPSLSSTSKNVHPAKVCNETKQTDGRRRGTVDRKVVGSARLKCETFPITKAFQNCKPKSIPTSSDDVAKSEYHQLRAKKGEGGTYNRRV